MSTYEKGSKQHIIYIVAMMNVEDGYRKGIDF